jgi:murein DD-endopeptidase MepM/ murein hydrolase activator NlpD
VIRTDQPWAGPHLVQVSTGTGQLTTWYAHMRAVTVPEGTQVRARQQIGEVGDLGNATGRHLHFEVRPHGGSIYQDDMVPSAWLKAHVGHPTEGSLPCAQRLLVRLEPRVHRGHLQCVGQQSHGPERQGRRMASGPVRTHGAVRILNRYGVDVVGLPEFQRPQADEFKRLASSTYALWWPPGETPENASA